MSTYDIVHDIRYGIRYAHTMSYITDIRYRMYLQTYDIVYVMESLCSTISYVVHTTSHVDIRYHKNIRYRTYDIVCPTMQYRIYDIVHTIWYTTSNTGHTISYVETYDIVCDIRYRMWQESRWVRGSVPAPAAGPRRRPPDRLSHDEIPQVAAAVTVSDD